MENKTLLKNVAFCLFAVVAMGVIKTVFSRTIRISSRRRFYKVKKQEDFYDLVQTSWPGLAVALFYERTKGMRKGDPEAYRRTNNLIDMFRKEARQYKKEGAEILFIGVNLAKSNNEALREAYKIKKTPVTILFKNGKPYRDAKGKLQALPGFISSITLRKLIFGNFGKEIRKEIERKRRIRQRELELSRIRYYNYGPGWYGGWGWGYPYGGWGYPYRGWGWGIGWRGGWGRRGW